MSQFNRSSTQNLTTLVYSKCESNTPLNVLQSNTFIPYAISHTYFKLITNIVTVIKFKKEILLTNKVNLTIKSTTYTCHQL